MIKGVIFDLDQTLVDTSISEGYRRDRNWSKVYGLTSSFQLYDGISIVLKYLTDNNIRICIVTASQGKYAKKVLDFFNIPFDYLVDYYSTARKKPFPEPMLKALELFNLSPDEVISFGDRKIDIISSESAHIKSAACMWGTNEKRLLIDSSATYFIHEPQDIIKIIKPI